MTDMPRLIEHAFPLEQASLGNLGLLKHKTGTDTEIGYNLVSVPEIEIKEI
jgi:hypothetical protein